MYFGEICEAVARDFFVCTLGEREGSNEGVDQKIMFWFIQTVIISGATFITFLIPALLGYHMSQDTDSSRMVLTAWVLGTACVANAVMMSILFEYVHRSAFGKKSGQETRGTTLRGAVHPHASSV